MNKQNLKDMKTTLTKNERRKEIGTEYQWLLSGSNVPNMVCHFKQLIEKEKLSDEEYSVLLGSVWQRGFTGEWQKKELIELFDSPRCNAELLMSEMDYNNFHELLDKDLTLYRYMSNEEYESGDYRIAWTLRLDVAVQFWLRGKQKGVIARLRISNENRKDIKIKSYFNTREEYEVILLIEKKYIAGVDLLPVDFIEYSLSKRAYNVLKIEEEILSVLRREMLDENILIFPEYQLGECIMNSSHFAQRVENATKRYLVEGIAKSESGKIFPHMWNRFVINGESKEYDVTHDLLMESIPVFSYYKICEYDADIKNIAFSKTTMFIAHLYWELFPQSKPEK